VADAVKVPTVAELMATPPVTAEPEEALVDVARRMEEHRVGAVVVVEAGRPVGTLTERDVVRALAAGAAGTANVGAWSTATPPLAPGTAAPAALDALLARGATALAVVDDGAVVGTLSLADLLAVASLSSAATAGEAPPGLKGVVVAETEVGDVRGAEGFYHYRQHDAVELADKRTLEDVWHLLFEGELPDAAQRAAFVEEVGRLREVPASIKPLLPGIARSGERFSPLNAMRTAVSLLADAGDFRPSFDVDAATLKANAMQVCAVIPTLVMSLHRLNQGLEPVDPHPDLGYGANYLWMLTGEVPDPDVARGIEQYLITTVDHGFNASTFTSRVVTSTGADLGAAVVAAIGALSGPLHGGAPSRALDLLDAIGTVENARPHLTAVVERREKIMGFGHAIYRTEDPRSVFLRGVAERMGAEKIGFAREVERAVVEVLAELKPGRDLYANVEFYAGVVMDHCGLPRDLFTPTFASSRVIGWCANILEQAADNRIMRPSARYVGPPPPVPVPDLEVAR
jgi:citrate synthase